MERTLLIQINEDISAEVQSRFDELVAKRQQEAISVQELDELIRLTDQIEQHDARRLAALGTLAASRHVTLPTLMDSLGLPPPAYA